MWWRLWLRIETATKYICNGCKVEAINPYGWSQIDSLHNGSFAMNLVNSMTYGEHYCNSCMSKMRTFINTQGEDVVGADA